MGQDCRHLRRRIAGLAWLVLVFLYNVAPARAIRFTVDRKECFSYNVESDRDTVHASYVVVEVESSWKFEHSGVDVIVEAPTGHHVHSARQKVEEKFEFVATKKGHYKFCFYNHSPIHETVVFDVHIGHVPPKVEHATDEHFDPILDQVTRLEDALYNVQFEQHWLHAQTERQALVNSKMSSRVIYKALWESTAMISASVLQVYLLRRLFERKLGFSRV